jgi:hypothetical protein
MPFTVVQGPLVNDHVSVNPSNFLEAWISGTQVYGLDEGAFKGGTLSFVISTTDEPDLNHRFPGMLWFKRGEGRLYIWDQADAPSGPSDATANNVNWLSLSDRRDMWAFTVEAVPPGTPLYFSYFTTPQSGTGADLFVPTAESLSAGDDDPFFGRTLWSLSAYAGPNGSTGIKSCMTDAVVFTALESTSSGGKARVCEWGFCDVLMASGDTGIAGPLAWDATASNTQWFRCLNYTTPSMNSRTAKWSYIGYIFTSSATNGDGVPWLRRAYKHPMACWAPTGGTLA